MRRRLKRLLLALVLTSLALGAVIKFVVAPFIVVGDSMEPTLHSLDLCVMRRVRHYQPERGDIVMLRTTDDPPLYFVKRVIGLPGETIVIEGGFVKINGALLYEPYAPTNPGLELALTNIPPGKVFVIGDNRFGSLNTFVSTRLIQAKLLWNWRWKK
jgi:signal peptidase I